MRLHFCVSLSLSACTLVSWHHRGQGCPLESRHAFKKFHDLRLDDDLGGWRCQRGGGAVIPHPYQIVAEVLAALQARRTCSDQNAFLQRALKMVVSNGNEGLVDISWMDPRTNPDVDEQHALLWACATGHDKVVKILLKALKVDPSMLDQLAIRVAARNGHYMIVRRLLGYPSVDPSASGQYALKWAAVNGHERVVALLLGDQRVDPRADNDFAMKWASLKGHVHIVHQLMSDPRVDPAADNRFPLRFAACHKHEQVVELLLSDPRMSATAVGKFPSLFRDLPVKVFEACVVGILLPHQTVDLTSRQLFYLISQSVRNPELLCHLRTDEWTPKQPSQYWLGQELKE